MTADESAREPAGEEASAGDRFAASAAFVAAGLGVALSATAWTPGLGAFDVGNAPGLVASVVALLAFAGRRYGSHDTRLSVVGGAGMAALALSALGGVLVPALGPGTEPAWVGPALPVGFVVGLAGVGLAVLDARGVPQAGVLRRGGLASAMLGVALVGLFVGSLAAAVARSLATAAGAGEATAYAVASAVSPLGFVVVAVGAVLVIGEDIRYFDVRAPTRREWLWTAGTFAGMVAVLLTLSTIEGWLGLSQASHDTLEFARGNPAVLLVLVPVSVLFIGPGEELLNRNVVQKHLYEAFSRPAAIVVASVFFASMHVFSYWTAGPAAVAVALVNLLAISLVLAYAYERTENVVVVALAHGGYNAVQFLYAYYTLTG
ncbi:CPBP family intramembrane glutamic endopeptidase [Halocalculus aciditolerans]|uniref:CPBP family intramembrane metalloprotease domain-containing protein n=1 Tax=Halocalculus aciditolerans TaxID=1383812 RepID=A0A830FEQ7_9EURY|nr:CPBP family intramembrane glutamic endopeptidase [Halocalculus aciditolerans]GGL47823.1 CPBP family intramembrane metalloprotease domain-containing protein [Halocalculus aciditolerans]